jgi:hypothetical protein
MAAITIIMEVRMAPSAYDNGKAILAAILDPEGGTRIRKGYHE